jgi:hypothetical protein
MGYLIGGLGFSYFSDKINSNLLVAMLMVLFLTIIAVVFLRETKTEESLMNYYEDIFNQDEELPVNNN